MVGVPPAQSPSAFMKVTEFKLPKSGIRGYISNGTQMFISDQPNANVYHPDFESSYKVFREYDFDEDTTLRYALDLIEGGRAK